MDKRNLFFIFIVMICFVGVKLGFYVYDTKQEQEALKTQKIVHPVKKEVSTPQPQPPAEVTKTALPQLSSKEQKYFVLENGTMQLVFSNVGGALCEVNLPFETAKNPNSVVLPIEFDRELQDQKGLSLFPYHEAITSNGALKKQTDGGYYPFLRRSSPIFTIPPRLFACNVVSEYPEVALLTYDVQSFSDKEIVFVSTQPHRKITKRFFFPDDSDKAPYCLKLDIKIDGDTEGLWLGSGVPEVEWISNASGAAIKYRISRNNKASVEKVDLPKEIYNLSGVYPDWICDSNGFFGEIVDPMKGAEAGFRVERIPGTVAPSRLYFIDRAQNRFPLAELPGFLVLVPLKKTHETLHYRFFIGPFAEKVLKQVDRYFAEKEGELESDYLSSQTFHGWFAFISEPFAKFLFFIMKMFYAVFGSWALSIVMATVALRLLLYPLNAWSLRSVRGMQLIAPQIKAIQDRHKKDPQKAQLEIVELYRKNGVNPLSGCLPLLIQMPFLIGMFDLLKSTFELRGACFIPGWINDLSAPDTLFSWGFSIPFLGNQFHLLPVLLGGIMFLQQNMMSPLPKDQSQWTDQQRQQRAMGNVMTVVMSVLFYHFPSGLNIYWISSMLLAALQQWWTNRHMPQPVEAVRQPYKKK